MDVRLAGTSDQQRWDDYVEQHTETSPYHRFAWGRAVASAYGHKLYYLMIEEDQAVVGVLPMVCMKTWKGVPNLVSLPFCDLGGVTTGKRSDVADLLFEKAVSIAKDLQAAFLEVRCSVAEMVSPEGCVNGVQTKDHKVRMVLALPKTSQELWDNFKSKLRSQVRKSEKNGCRFSWGGLESLDAFYQVFSLNMRDLGSPVHSKNWFRNVVEHYGSNVRMGLVSFERKIIGVSIMLLNGTQVAIPWASTLRSHNRLSPNMLLYWNMIQYAADHGFRCFDFGRSSPNEGTYHFKAQWGAEPVPLFWHYLTTNGKPVKSGPEHSSARTLVEHMWRKLPLAVANRIGPAIRRQISL